MVKKIAAGFSVVLAAFLVFVATRPNEFHVERSITIQAPPAKVYPWLEDPQKTLVWSPWEKKDPQMKKTFSGAAKGVGAVYEWSGNKEIGSGRLEIIEAVAPSKVVMNMHFITPMDGHSVAEYTVTPADGGGSVVTWSISGPQPFLSKLVCVFMNMDKMIGGEFEKGLGDLKAVVEK